MSIADYQAEVKKRAAKYNEVFSGHPGQDVLRDLEDTYLHIELFNSDPIVMAGNVAARDVVVRIKNLMRVAQNVSTEDTVT